MALAIHPINQLENLPLRKLFQRIVPTATESHLLWHDHIHKHLTIAKADVVDDADEAVEPRRTQPGGPEVAPAAGLCFFTSIMLCYIVVVVAAAVVVVVVAVVAAAVVVVADVVVVVVDAVVVAAAVVAAAVDVP